MSTNKNFMTVVKTSQPNSNAFDLTHAVDFSGNMGRLYPVLAMECIPGDYVKLGCDALVRFAPLIAPVMHRFDFTMHYFFVPNRLLWPNWEKFITQNNDGDPIPAHPYVDIPASTIDTESNANYLGLPNNVNPPAAINGVNPFSFAACNLVWNEYYRDQNLQDKLLYELIDGNNSANLSDLIQPLRRAWNRDYFTSALPDPQMGNPAQLPLGFIGTNVPVYLNNSGTDTTLSGSPLNVDVTGQASSGGGAPNELYAETIGLQLEPTTINDLRIMIKMQEWLEKMMRGGHRYTEMIQNIFGVKPQDARLQRPEYITGVKTPIIISEVLQTSESNASPQGNMAGHGVGVANGDYGSYYCSEHGYIIAFASVMPLTKYKDNIPKHFLKGASAFDYFTPQFANVGEQAILRKEVHYDNTNPDEEFGYTPRYAEYKTIPNRVAGEFATDLNYWTAVRIFTPPTNISLNEAFIQCNPTFDFFAVTDPEVHHLYISALHKIWANRPMPRFGTPTF